MMQRALDYARNPLSPLPHRYFGLFDAMGEPATEHVSSALKFIGPTGNLGGMMNPNGF